MEHGAQVRVIRLKEEVENLMEKDDKAKKKKKEKKKSIYTCSKKKFFFSYQVWEQTGLEMRGE